MSSINPYEVLGIPINSSLEDVKRVYKIIALKSHPDKLNNINDINERNKKIKDFIDATNAYNKILKGDLDCSFDFKDYDFNDYDTENLDNIDKSSLFYYLEKNTKKSEYYFSKYYIYNKIDEYLEECKNFKELSQYARSTIEKYYEDSFSENASVSYGI